MSYESDPAFKAWVKCVRRELVPKLEESAVVMSLVPDGEGDVKFAVELGFSILMDKPIIAVVTPGRKVPDKLVRVADRIVEADLSTDEGRDKGMRAMKTACAELGVG